MTPAQRESGRPWLQWLQATLGNTLRFFSVQDICYFRSDGKYTRVVAADDDALIRRSLSALLEDLDPAMFWQINRGIVVNVRHIDRVVRDDLGEMAVHVRGRAEALPVSKTHHSRFRGM